MGLMILAFGILIAAGILILFFKCSWRWRMLILSHPVKVDLALFVLLNILHGGSFFGPIVGAEGALICSVFLWLGRKVWGCYDDNNYYLPGWCDVTRKLFPPNPPAPINITPRQPPN